MQQPVHAIRGTAHPRHASTIVLTVGALHIAAIFALYEGLIPGIAPSTPPVIHFTPLKDIAQPARPDLPMPADPKLVDVKLDVETPPIFNIENPITLPSRPVHGNTANVTLIVPVGPSIPPVPARAIAPTHTTPDYPSLARRLNQEGSVHLKLSVAADGSVSAASVETSSGYAQLDDAAITWVTKHWRYQPAVRDGKPASSTTEAVVTFKLQQG